eukprot:7654108-Karenia_brevis.AAC.1
MGKKHVKTCMDLYKLQMKEGRYFLHEHPAYADSWCLDATEQVKRMKGVYVVSGPMCRFGMKSEDAQGEGLVKKETRWMTNSPELADVLQ